MKIVNKLLTALFVIGLSAVSTASYATITFSQNVTPDVIFGSGNSNGNFTIDSRGVIELGLRAKIPFAGTINSNGDGTYSYTLAETDHDNDASTPNRWNFDWTVNIDSNNSSALNLEDYTYELGLDSDPSLATNFLVFNPITPTAETPYFDHSIGNNSTGNGAGIEAPSGNGAAYSSLLAANNVLQQSWRYAFFAGSEPLNSYDPEVAGSYVIYLLARNTQGAVVARTEIQVLIEGASASLANDVTPDVIFGSGNANGNFTVNKNNGVETGLRAKIPFSGVTNFNRDGTYSYSLSETDHDGIGASANRWNFDWTVNVDASNGGTSKLNQYTYEIGLDGDPSLATDFLVFDPITPSPATPFYDHSIGNNATANGGGAEASDGPSYTDLLAANSVLQQSWRYSFFPAGALASYNPTAPGTYAVAVYLLVKDQSGAVVSRSDIQVLIGGALAAPEPQPEPEKDLSLCPVVKTQMGKVFVFCL